MKRKLFWLINPALSPFLSLEKDYPTKMTTRNEELKFFAKEPLTSFMALNFLKAGKVSESIQFTVDKVIATGAGCETITILTFKHHEL